MPIGLTQEAAEPACPRVFKWLTGENDSFTLQPPKVTVKIEGTLRDLQPTHKHRSDQTLTAVRKPGKLLETTSVVCWEGRATEARDQEQRAVRSLLRVTL